MQGLKYVLFGIAVILIGGFILVDVDSNLGGFGEIALFIIGIALCIKGLNTKD